MMQPSGFEDGTDRICKLDNVLYGLKQAPRTLFQKLSSSPFSFGFQMESLILLCLYVIRMVILCFYSSMLTTF